jgi:hypothetical protein
MNKEDIINALDDAKNLLDGVYYHYESDGTKPWIRNNLTTIDLLIIELLTEIGGDHE